MSLPAVHFSENWVTDTVNNMLSVLGIIATFSDHEMLEIYSYCDALYLLPSLRLSTPTQL